MQAVTHRLNLLIALSGDRSRLPLEDVALRQQTLVLKRTVRRARINGSDRAFWILMRRMLRDWKEALLLAKPETVVRWHPQGFRYYWRWKPRARPGRPPLDMKTIFLTKRMSRDNPL